MSFDFDAAVSAPFRMQPGLRRLAPGALQLTPLAPGSRHLREKLAVLSAFAEQALVARPGFDPQPALQALCAQAAAEHPRHFQWQGDAVAVPTLGVRLQGGAVQAASEARFSTTQEVARCIALQPPPWRLPALLALAFAEDLAIVDAGEARVPWMAVALPSHWAPEHKVGLDFAQLHAPVADGERVRHAGEALLHLVAGTGRWERFVWNVTDQPRLHAHPHRVDDRRWAAGLDRAWFRSERQTFVPVPGQAQAVFTIAVDVQPLADVVGVPGRARRLAEAIASMSPAVLAYRGLTPVRDALLAWLAAR
jgi:hypothetical protein